MAALASILRRIEALESACPAEHNEVEEAETEAQIAGRFAAYELKAEAYAGLSIPEKIAEKRRELAETIDEWKARDPNAFCLNTELIHTLRRRQLEIDVEELEGASNVEALRTQAHEEFRFRGRPQPAPINAERASVVATVDSREERDAAVPVDPAVVDRFLGFRPTRDPYIEP